MLGYDLFFDMLWHWIDMKSEWKECVYDGNMLPFGLVSKVVERYWAFDRFFKQLLIVNVSLTSLIFIFFIFCVGGKVW